MEFRILSGEAYAVQADNADEALQKAYDFFNGLDCPTHPDENCKCVEEIEADTIVVDAAQIMKLDDEKIGPTCAYADDEDERCKHCFPEE